MVPQARDCKVIVGDPWLFELAMLGKGHARIAIILLRTQAQTCSRTGHIMDFGQEYVRRRLKAASRFDIIPAVQVRCMRCDIKAYLNDWCTAMTMTDSERTMLLQQKYAAGTEKAYRFMQRCEGKQMAVDTDQTIAALLGG